MLSSLVFSSLVCSGNAQTANASAKAPSPLEQTLMAAEKSFVDAAKKGDVAFFKRTLTDDFSFVQFDGQLYDRQDMLDQFGDGGMDLQPYDMKVVMAGDGVAIVTYNVVLRVPAAEDQGPPPTGEIGRNYGPMILILARKAPWNAVDGVFFRESNTVPRRADGIRN